MFTRIFHPLAAVLLLLAAGTTVSRAADPVVYSQPYSTGSYSIWASCSSGDNYATCYDNFTLAAMTSVTAVQWRGAYAASNPADNPIAPDVASFSVSFYADNAGQPGALLSTGTVDLADCNPQPLGTVGLVYDGTNPTSYQVTYASYSATLPTPFAAAAGQQYWISIYANTTTEDLWGWYSGTGGDNITIQDFDGSINRPQDRAFTLEGVSATPSVSAAATVAKTAVGSGTPAVVTLTLSAPAAAKLKVKYLLGGNAVNGTDYQALSGSAKFKPGQTSVDVQIVGEGDLGGASKKTVTLTVEPGTGYTVGTTTPAKVKIAD